MYSHPILLKAIIVVSMHVFFVVLAAKIHGTTLTNKGILQGSTLSSLLQGAVRASVPKASVGIKGKTSVTSNFLNCTLVLENITLSSNSTAKLVSSSGRTIDLSKITVLNSGGVTTSTGGSGYGNLMLMSEKGKAGGEDLFARFLFAYFE